MKLLYLIRKSSILYIIKRKFLYYFEAGECPLKVDKNSTPEKEGCVVEKKQEIYITEYQIFDGVEIRIENHDSNLVAFCALYDIDRNIIDFQLDLNNTGYLLCTGN